MIASQETCPSYVLKLVRVNQEAVLDAADRAATQSARGERSVVVLIDGLDARARLLVEHLDRMPEDVSDMLDRGMVSGIALVSRIDAAKALAGSNTRAFDEAVLVAEATRAMLVVVCCLGGTYVCCLPRAGAVVGRA